jgi:hypothetical protein
MKRARFKHETVSSIPEVLQGNTLYVAADGDVAGHLCACGCGREVITPLSPTDWSISFDTRGPTLSPSIGNWAFPCRSHYFIWNGAVVWARDMSQGAIDGGRRLDKERKEKYYACLHEQSAEPATTRAPEGDSSALDRTSPSQPTRGRLAAWWRRLWGVPTP